MRTRLTDDAKFGAMGNRNLFERCFQRMLVQIRQENAYTQKSLSVKSGLSRQFISQLETGARTPSFESFCKIAWGLDMTPAKLLERFMLVYELEKGRDSDVLDDSGAKQYIRRAKNRK